MHIGRWQDRKGSSSVPNSARRSMVQHLLKTRTVIHECTHRSFWLVRSLGCFFAEASELPIILSCSRVLPLFALSDACLLVVDEVSLLVIVPYHQAPGRHSVQQLRLRWGGRGGRGGSRFTAEKNEAYLTRAGCVFCPTSVPVTRLLREAVPEKGRPCSRIVGALPGRYNRIWCGFVRGGFCD